MAKTKKDEWGDCVPNGEKMNEQQKEILSKSNNLDFRDVPDTPQEYPPDGWKYKNQAYKKFFDLGFTTAGPALCKALDALCYYHEKEFLDTIQDKKNYTTLYNNDLCWTGNIYQEKKEYLLVEIAGIPFQGWRNAERHNIGYNARQRDNHRA